ncbi:hypothetical protein CpipJ_CPIJ010922, partial [Culex quinquefasciatus]
LAVISLFRGIRVWKLFRRRSFRGVAKKGNFSKKGKTRAGLFRSAERPPKKKSNHGVIPGVEVSCAPKFAVNV